AYLRGLAQNPVLLRTLFVEILGLGAEGLAARRRMSEVITDFMLKIVNGERGQPKRKVPLTRELALAVVGGIHELVLDAIERDCVNDLQGIVAPAIRLVRAATQNPQR
ncbi:MAG TPA: TetR family transcriptional regulator, partial [Burkholderiaceae bacterium]|nr:TetR family transcriptional regulator [Burkholderiaceae bacterium]